MKSPNLTGKFLQASINKEGHAFKEWLLTKTNKAKEDMEDIFEEGKHAYEQDLETMAQSVKREKEILTIKNQ